MQKERKLNIINNKKDNTIKLQPWYNEDGTYKSDEEIELLGKKWSYQTWDAYFCSQEDEPREKSFPRADDVENISNEDCITFFYSYSDSEKYPHLRMAVNYCLDLLPPRQKEVVILKYWENKSQYEIAKELNLSRSAVQGHLRTARQKLKKMIVDKKLQQYINTLEQLVKKQHSENKCA